MNLAIAFRPKWVDALKGYRRPGLVADLIADLTVGTVALPLAMAFAIAPGVKPEAAGFTAVIAGVLDRLGRENVCANIELSPARAREIPGRSCAGVRKRRQIGALQTLRAGQGVFSI
jgi:hypothetical protein